MPEDVSTKKISKLDAIYIIQKAWRRHVDVQVFKYYRDLITFPAHGTPATMLRCINPLEAKLLDQASGVHVRFRLIGEKFPPKVCYKIYTHRPVQDMCSNSPKNYSHESNKQPLARQIHNRVKNGLATDNHVGWYERCENNGWRLVADRLLVSNKMVRFFL